MLALMAGGTEEQTRLVNLRSDAVGITGLMRACASGQAETAKRLLELKADPLLRR